MSKSKAQKFAQKRNTAGGTLKGIVINLKENIIPVCTEDELKDLKKARDLLGNVLNNWSTNYEQSKKENL